MMKFIQLFVAFTLISFSIVASSKGNQHPNIVIIFTDDMGYADLGTYGNPYIRTPNLDRMAQEGQKWTDFYVSSPVCSPSRGSLMTGKVPMKSGLYGRKYAVMFPNDDNGIPASEVTLAEALKKQGYKTGIFGKWHLGDKPEHYPTRNGFDYWFGIPYSNDMDRVDSYTVEEVAELTKRGEYQKVSKNYTDNFKLFASPKSEYWQVPLYRSIHSHTGYDDSLVERPVQQETLTKRLTDEAISFIKANKDSPFLAYIPYSMPHLPVFSSDQFKGKSLRGRYGDAVEEIDWNVGKIREALEKMGLTENTLVVFASDNGPWSSVSTEGSGSAGMLRGTKASTYEGGMRVPAIFWWPGTVQPSVVSGIGSMVDVYATVLNLAGADLPSDSDGLDLTKSLKYLEQSPRQEMPYYMAGQLRAYRKGKYKLHFIVDDPSSGYGATKTLDSPALYNLQEDLGEKNDISNLYPDIVSDIIKAAEKHKASYSPEAPIFDARFQSPKS